MFRQPSGFLQEPQGRPGRPVDADPAPHPPDLVRPGQGQPRAVREARGRDHPGGPGRDGGGDGSRGAGSRSATSGRSARPSRPSRRTSGPGSSARPKRFKCLYLWPRDEGYYARNDWAGTTARRRGGLGPRQPGPERHGPRPPQHVLHPGPGEGDERTAGRGRGRALPGQRHRELRHGGRPGADRGGRRDPVPGEPRLGRGPRTGRPLRVRERPS